MTVSTVTPPTRALHTMIRVGDLDRSMAFHVNALGIRQLRERKTQVIELTWVQWWRRRESNPIQAKQLTG